MRRTALLVLAPALGLAAAPAQAGYYCSPGFEARYGQCVATASSDEVDLYLNEPGGYDREELAPPPPVLRHRHRRHGLHERY